MENVDDLITGATEPADYGLSEGEIADELDASRETASWLAERSGAAIESEPRAKLESLGDIHVDWSIIGSDGKRLTYIGRVLINPLMETNDEADVTVGIEKAGVPLATSVSCELRTTLGVYSPARHQWNGDDLEDLDGGLSRDFPSAEGHDYSVVDGTVASGTTLRETIDAIRSEGGKPFACVIVVNKQDAEEIDGVPTHSLINTVRVGEH